MESTSDLTPLWLKPIEIKRIARVPYQTVIAWLTVGHPTAGLLRSVDLAAPGKRHSFRVARQDWDEFLNRLQSKTRTRRDGPSGPSQPAHRSREKRFRY